MGQIVVIDGNSHQCLAPMSGIPIHVPRGHARYPTQDVQAQLSSHNINMGTVIIIRADDLPGDCLIFRANQGSLLELKIFQCLQVAIDGLLS